MAEWVRARRQIAPGTVVTLDSTLPNAVVPSTRAYDTHVAGVISAQPGVILGDGGEGKVMVATTGRVKIKVDATRRPVRIGDLLVTSGRSGLAMKSMPIRVSGAFIHRPGTIIGKALEPLAKGRGRFWSCSVSSEGPRRQAARARGGSVGVAAPRGPRMAGGAPPREPGPRQQVEGEPASRRAFF